MRAVPQHSPPLRPRFVVAAMQMVKETERLKSPLCECTIWSTRAMNGIVGVSSWYRTLDYRQPARFGRLEVAKAPRALAVLIDRVDRQFLTENSVTAPQSGSSAERLSNGDAYAAADTAAVSAAGRSIAVIALFVAFCTLSKARTSICRMRSRDTPNVSASSSSVSGSSASCRASKMSRSRSLSTVERAGQAASCRSPIPRVRPAGFPGRACRRPASPAIRRNFRFAKRRIERGVRRRQAAVHLDHFALGDAQLSGTAWPGPACRSPSSMRADMALGLAQIEEQLLLRRGGAHLHQRPGAQEYSWIAALIHHMA